MEVMWLEMFKFVHEFGEKSPLYVPSPFLGDTDRLMLKNEKNKEPVKDDALHPLGIDLGGPQTKCQTCFWSKRAGPGPKVLRCVPSGMKRVHGDWRGCSFWQEEINCLDCAACCGPAFDAVEVSLRDPVRKKCPQYLEKVQGRWSVRRRQGNYCLALQEDNRCKIYIDRPKCCREFEKGSGNCLFARQRLDLSPIWQQKVKCGL